MYAIIGYLAIMAIVYFVVPIAFPTVDVTVIQATAITFLVVIARVTLTEGIYVKIHGVDSVEIEKRERD